MRRSSLLLTLLALLIITTALISPALAVTYPRMSDTQNRKVVVFTNPANDVPTVTSPLAGTLQRIVIGATGTEPAWSVKVADEDGVTLFYKTDCATTGVPYSYPVVQWDQTAVVPMRGVMTTGPLTCTISGLNPSTEVQTISVSNTGFTADAGYYTLTYGTATTAHIAYNDTTANIQSAVAALSYFGTANISCVAGTALGSGHNIVITATGNKTEQNLLPFSINVAALIKTGSAEVQTISCPTAGCTPDAGAYTITYNGATSAPIAYSATTATIDTALEAMASIGTGNIQAVAATQWGVSNNIVLTGTGTNAKGTLPMFKMNVGTLVDTGNAETQTLSIAASGVVPDAGYYTLTYGTATTAHIPFDATATAIRNAVGALAYFGTANITVTAAAPLAYGQDVVLTAAGTRTKIDLSAFTVTSTALIDTGNNEIQRLPQNIAAVSGTYTITYGTTTTPAIAWNAAKATIDTALDTAFGTATIVSTATGGIAANDIVLTFSGTGVAKTDVAMVTVDTSNLLDVLSAPVTITPAETLKGKADVSPTVIVTETLKGKADIIPTATVTRTTPGVADISPTCVVTETTSGGVSPLTQAYIVLYYNGIN
jgi:hypothetical protein